MTVVNQINKTLSIWITELERYDFDQLCAQPSPESWSLGQVYVHMVDNARYYVEQIRICLSTNDHAGEEVSPEGKKMFLNNSFPDMLIEGPPENAETPQPESKEQLMRLLLQAKKELNDAAMEIASSPFNGKTKHPGLNYFSARDWLQFADMHFRHHLRQKKRIDHFLNEKYNPGRGR